ncbi:MAG: hypothetical protein KUG79_18290 [Pseudomonadales bacterium]|nr:hypothetical protein [Pseudomonadales bacterium]
MITLTDTTLIGMLEVYLLLIGIITTAIYLYRRTKKRTQRLKIQLDQLKQTTLDLLDKVNHNRARYKDLLLGERQNTQSYFNESSPGADINCQQQQSTPAQAIALRFQFLDSEITALNAADESQHWDLIINNMNQIADANFMHSDTSNQPTQQNETDPDQPATTTPDTEKSGLSDIDALKESWPTLIKATQHFVEEYSTHAENKFIKLLQAYNTQLGFEKFDPPSKKSATEKSMAKHNDNIDINKIRDASEQQKNLIANLLSQRNAAESEITVKAAELERLQHYVIESDTCSKQMEDELSASYKEIDALNKKLGATNELEDALQQHIAEKDTMKICIETLEIENDSLRAQH